MTDSAGVEVAQRRLLGSVSLRGRPGSSLFFNETSYLPHEIDWSYINQEWQQQPHSFQNKQPDDSDHCWVPNPTSASASWTRNGISSLKENVESLDCDSSLFSSSLPSLFKAKLTMSESDIDHSINGADEEVFGSLEEMESQTIGNLLPDDEEELLANIASELDVAPYCAEDFEDYDLFSSGGGLELEGDSHDIFHHGSVAGEHPFGEHPSRTLFVRNINSNVEDSELQELFELYGDIRTLYTACKHRGFVMISYYDIRSARTAMRALQGRLLRRRKLDIHFSIPKDNPSDKDINQGTLVVFNLDASVSNDDLRQIFGVYGEVKEIRETPHKRHHKFIEYYDVRAAEAALRALNRSDIAGKRIKLEPSRPGGIRRRQLGQEFEADESHQSQISWANSPPVDWGITETEAEAAFLSPKSLNYRPFSPTVNCSQEMASPVRADSHSGQNALRNHLLEHGIGHHPHSLPEFNSGVYKNGSLYNGSVSGFSTAAAPVRAVEGFEARNLTRASSNLNESSTYGQLNGVHRPTSLQRSSSLSTSLSTSQPMLWGGTPYNQGTKNLWQSLSPGQAYNQRPADSHSNMFNSSAFSPHSHQAGSYSREHSERHHSSYMGESPEVSPFAHSGSYRTSSVGSLDHHGPSSPNFGMFLPQKLFGNAAGSVLDDRRNRRVDPMDNRKQFQLDLDRILSGDDTRTTLMIKNIPNKYTSKMILAAIDEQHRGTYDFIYLPIDFKNKCNVGYAFINMLSPTLIVDFYQTFNGKKWEKFNSEKVASLAYARIQGKNALIAHFQNSSLMNEDKRCRPIIFHSDGPNAGDQEPFPIGDSVRSRSNSRVADQMVEGFAGEFVSAEDVHMMLSSLESNNFAGGGC